jgi:predicted ATP-grasp superfamily ATP-dependent carboligase
MLTSSTPSPWQQPHIVEFDGVTVNQIDPAGDQGRMLGALAQHVTQALPGLRGFVGIDVVFHPSRGPVVIEVNPRLTVAYAGLSAALGGNLARTLLAAHEVRIGGSGPAARSCGAQSTCGARP